MKYALPIAAILVLVLAMTAAAQQSAQDVGKKLSEIDAKLKELNQLKEELTALRDGMKGAPGVPKKSWADKVRINGYFHARGQYSNWAQDDVDLRRMYINLIVTPNDRTMGVVTWSRIGPDAFGLTNTDWANVFVDYKWNDEWSTRFGQGPNSFGLETAQSSSERVALERASVLEGGRGRPPGLYFAGPWDRGLWVTRRPQGGEWDPQVTLGVINGQFRNAEADTNKLISLDLKWKQHWGEFGASWLDGRYTWDIPRAVYVDTSPPAAAPFYGTTFDREAILGYVRWGPADCRWAFQGEYVEGEHLGADIEGWYTQLEYQPNQKGTAFAKWEKHDAAVGAPGAMGSLDYSGYHVGYAHWLDANNEITLQLSDGDTSGANRTELALQWQFGF